MSKACLKWVTSFPSFVTMPRVRWFFFFFNDTATTEIYTLSLHDALPILPCWSVRIAGCLVDANQRRTDARHSRVAGFEIGRRMCDFRAEGQSRHGRCCAD